MQHREHEGIRICTVLMECRPNQVTGKRRGFIFRIGTAASVVAGNQYTKLGAPSDTLTGLA